VWGLFLRVRRQHGLPDLGQYLLRAFGLDPDICKFNLLASFDKDVRHLGSNTDLATIVGSERDWMMNLQIMESANMIATLAGRPWVFGFCG
jgi:hypothetical protein